MTTSFQLIRQYNDSPILGYAREVPQYSKGSSPGIDNFYTCPINGGITNHTHQLSNFGLIIVTMFQFNLLQIKPYLSQAFWMSEQMARRHGMMYTQQWLFLKVEQSLLVQPIKIFRAILWDNKSMESLKDQIYNGKKIRSTRTPQSFFVQLLDCLCFCLSLNGLGFT